MGNYPQPEGNAKVFNFTPNLLHLSFDLVRFIPTDKKDWPEPKYIEVTLKCQNCCEILGRTNTKIFKMKLPQKCTDEIKNSDSLCFTIGFRGLWDEEGKNPGETASKSEKTQEIFLAPNIDLAEDDLNLEDENTMRSQIQDYKKKIINYPTIYKDLKLNIMLFGMSKSGKSSFIHTLLYVLKKEKSQESFVINGILGQNKDDLGDSGTLGLKKIVIYDPWWILWDSPGVQTKDQQQHEEIKEFWTKNSFLDVCTNME